MNLLLIDSTKPELVVAWARDGQIVARETCAEQRQHDKNINPLIKKLQAPQYDAVAVVTGPGSWTGIRVGLAVAKAYCYVWQVPLVELHDCLAVDVALEKLARGDVISPFAIKPFYNGEFVVKNQLPPHNIS